MARLNTTSREAEAKRLANELMAKPRRERDGIAVLSKQTAIAAHHPGSEGRGTPAVVGAALAAGALGGGAFASAAAASAGTAATLAAVASPTAIATGPVGPGLAGALGASAGGIAGLLGYYAYRKLVKKHPMPGVPVYTEVAQFLPFADTSEPRDDTFYACHPKKDLYIPLADFHRVVWEDKIQEANDVFQCLGASRIEVTVNQGFGWGADGSMSIPHEVTMTGRVGAGKSSSRAAHMVSEQPGRKKPRIDPSTDPQRFCWYPSEPTWQRLYDHRLESGLEKQELTIEYANDFGVNAELGATIKKLNLNIGGNFGKFEKTVWTWKLEFPKL